MREIVLEGKKFVDSITTHEILKDLFKFPDYYGKNLNAFWDCITDWYIDDKAQIIWKDFNESKRNIGDEADMLLQIFQEASEEYNDFIIEVIP